MDHEAAPFSQIGEGYFAVMLDQGEGMVPYQGFTPIAGTSLANCAETYFAQSEQLPTRFALSFGRSQVPGEEPHWRAGGVMLQHMPQAGMSVEVAADAGSGDGGLLHHTDILGGDAGENWTRCNILLDTVEELELIGLLSLRPICLFGFSMKKNRGCLMPNRCDSAVRVRKTRCAARCRSTARRTSAR